MLRRTFNQMILSATSGLALLRAYRAPAGQSPPHRKPDTQAERWAETIVSLLGDHDPLTISEPDMLAKLTPLLPNLKQDEETLRGQNPDYGIIQFAATFLEQVTPHTLWALSIEISPTDSQGHALFPPLFRRLSSHLLHTEWRLSFGGKIGSTEAEWIHKPDALLIRLTHEGDHLTLKLEEGGERPAGPR